MLFLGYLRSAKGMTDFMNDIDLAAEREKAPTRIKRIFAVRSLSSTATEEEIDARYFTEDKDDEDLSKNTKVFLDWLTVSTTLKICVISMIENL